MRIILIKPSQPALLARALDRLIKGLMLERANCIVLEDREASTRAVDQAVALKRYIGEIDDDEGATLIVGSYPGFPGLAQMRSACDELFGLGCTPEILGDALKAHEATLAVGMAAAMLAGTHAKGVIEAARAVVEEYGNGESMGPAVGELERAVDVIDAFEGAPDQFTQDKMNEGIEEAKRRMPGVASWIAAARASWEADIRETAADNFDAGEEAAMFHAGEESE